MKKELQNDSLDMESNSKQTEEKFRKNHWLKTRQGILTTCAVLFVVVLFGYEGNWSLYDIVGQIFFTSIIYVVSVFIVKFLRYRKKHFSKYPFLSGLLWSFVSLAICLLPALIYMALIYGDGEPDFATLSYVEYTDSMGEVQNRKAPDFGFLNQDSLTFTSKDLEGKIYVVDFFFTSCPSICPIMTANMLKLQKRFSSFEDFEIVSFTVDPKRDTPERLREYADQRMINTEKWNFLTGEQDSLYAVAYDYLSSAMEDSLAAGGFLHTEYFVLVDKEGNLRSRYDLNGDVIGVYDGTSAEETSNLMDDVKVLMAEYHLKLKKMSKD